MATIHISLSKKHTKAKTKNPRSAFLSAFMSIIASHGEVVDAFSGRSRAEFKDRMTKLAEVLAAKMPNATKVKE